MMRSARFTEMRDAFTGARLDPRRDIFQCDTCSVFYHGESVEALERGRCISCNHSTINLWRVAPGREHWTFDRATSRPEADNNNPPDRAPHPVILGIAGIVAAIGIAIYLFSGDDESPTSSVNAGVITSSPTPADSLLTPPAIGLPQSAPVAPELGLSIQPEPGREIERLETLVQENGSIELRTRLANALIDEAIAKPLLEKERALRKYADRFADIAVIRRRIRQELENPF